jgi:hypothetical protein
MLTVRAVIILLLAILVSAAASLAEPLATQVPARHDKADHAEKFTATGAVPPNVRDTASARYSEAQAFAIPFSDGIHPGKLPMHPGAQALMIFRPGRSAGRLP